MGTGLLNVLKNRCKISEAFDPKTVEESPQILEFDAIWDTGATNCVISQAVIDACGLIPTGRTIVYSVDGQGESDTYLVNIFLPNSVGVTGVRVTKGSFPGADILIGMDIIAGGDFAVTNFDGITKFSFRIPSETHIDFVAESQRNSLVPQFQHGGSSRKRTKGPKPAKRWGK